jgi:HlyD family secretion protein
MEYEKTRNKLLNKKSWLVTLAFLTVLAVAAFTYWGRDAKAAEYLTAPVERGNVRNTVAATGTLEAVTTVQVGSQASGTIAALYADFNSTVKKGQIVAQLDPAVFQAQVAQQRANLAQAQAALVDAQAKVQAARSGVLNERAGVSSANANLAALKAQRDDTRNLLERQRALATSGLIPQRDLESAQTSFNAADARYNQAAAQVEQARVAEQVASSSGLAQAQAQVQQAQAQVQQAQAALRLAEVNLSHTTITSPIDGVVVSRNVDVGQTVAASLSAPTLFTIANDLTHMQVIANVDQADIGVVNQENHVSFTVDAFPGQTFKGAIRQVRLNPQNVSNVITYNVVIDVQNPELKLKPGMTANLTFTVAERQDVLKVPNAALRFRPQNANNTRAPGQATGQSTGQATGQGTGQATGQTASRAGGQNGGNGQRAGGRNGTFASANAAVLPGQTRTVWVLGPDKQPQPRRLEIGITDGSATEVVSGNLQVGELLIVGETTTGESRPATNQRAPGFGGAPGGRFGGRR